MTNRIVQGTILALVLALVLNFLIYFLSRNLGVTHLAKMGDSVTTVGAGNIIFATLVAIIGAAAVLWLLGRFSGNPLYTFLWVAAIVALLSLLLPYTQAIGLGSFASLGLMHVATALAATAGLALFLHRCENC